MSAGRRARSLLRILWTLLALLLVYWVVLWPLQRLIVFPRTTLRAPDPPTVAIAGVERLWLETEAGRVEAWYMRGAGRSARSPGPAVIFAHGNAELIDDWPSGSSPYREARRHRAHPRVPRVRSQRGEPVPVGDHRGLRALLRPGRGSATRDRPRARIVLHGRSLGGGAVARSPPAPAAAPP